MTTARPHRAHVFGVLGVTILLNACGSDLPAGPPGPELRRGTGGTPAGGGGNGSGGSPAQGGGQGTGDPVRGGAGGGAGGGASGAAGVAGQASGGLGGIAGAGGGAGATASGGAGGSNDAGAGEACGGFLVNARSCKKGLFCEGLFPDLACVLDVGGTCQPVPEVCSALYAPVCGCDGKTYSSDCVRQAAGVSKLSDGECPKDGGRGGGSGGANGDGGRDGHQRGVGEACGGNAANAGSCAKGLFCDGSFPDLACVPDVGGTCQEVPSSCTKEYQPVCGCDCKTYGNDCTRRAAGVSKRADGECVTVDEC